ncbi:hypothetical protein F8M41_003712 [Gigaspora margarita]|uniref:MULE transposase domain-containing protein n=1 Tax=Gigaspora margarita TaxID=4874 RepID=A0A8H4A7J3_GIGMA|nr:hypothetical protein F8M41_003712 [Gigaspora margarita]
MSLLLNEAMLNNNEPGRLLPIDINAIFDIDEESDMDISDNEIDDALDRIMDATDGVGEMWEMQDDDDILQDSHNTEKSKTFHLSADSYEEWIKNLEKAGLSYIRHEHKAKESGSRKKYSYIKVMLPVDSTTVILQHYYKHNNHQSGHLSDLCTLPLSDNIRHFIRQRALEGLDTHSIQQLLWHRGIELQDHVQLLEQGTESQNIQSLRDGLVTRDDIYTIVHITLKSCAYLDNDELRSLIKWQEKLSCVGGYCLFNNSGDENKGFMFAFQTEKQKELIKFARVVCLDTTGSGYPVAFLISKFKRLVTLKAWLDFLKEKNSEWNPDIFMVDDAGKEIKAVEECFPNANEDLWQLMKTKGWDDSEALRQITEAINKWRRMGVEASTKFADYFERWWKSKYDKWMVCLRGVARDMMDTNNLIEAFHRKLKYVYMRGRPKRRLDSEVYLLVEIVLQDLNFSVFLDDLNIGRMNPRRQQQRI